MRSLTRQERFSQIYAHVGRERTLEVEHDPRALGRFRRSFGSVVIRGSKRAPLARGYPFQRCEIGERFVTDAQVGPEVLASARVRESMLTHLTSIGHGSRRGDRARVYVICAMAELSFARSLPDGGTLEERACVSIDRWSRGGEAAAAAALQAHRESFLRSIGMRGRLISRFLDWMESRTSASARN